MKENLYTWKLTLFLERFNDTRVLRTGNSSSHDKSSLLRLLFSKFISDQRRSPNCTGKSRRLLLGKCKIWAFFSTSFLSETLGICKKHEYKSVKYSSQNDWSLFTWEIISFMLDSVFLTLGFLLTNFKSAGIKGMVYFGLDVFLSSHNLWNSRKNEESFPASHLMRTLWDGWPNSIHIFPNINWLLLTHLTLLKTCKFIRN